MRTTEQAAADELRNTVKALTAIRSGFEKQILNFIDLRNEFTVDFGRFLLESGSNVFNNGKSMEMVVEEFANSWSSKKLQ